MVSNLSFKSIKVFSHLLFNTADKSRDHYELFPEETLRSLEENGVKFMLKSDQKNNFLKKRIF